MTIRIGLIGCGGMGENHASHLQDLSPLGEIAAVVDIDKDRLQVAAKHFPQSKAVPDFHDILDDVDAALISLPHHLHHSVGMECLRAGKHVLMEKPMALSEAECLELIQTAEEAGLTLMTAYCMRYHPLVVKMKELLDQKYLGEVFNISLWTEQHTEYPPDHWSSISQKLGGGQLFSHGCHYVDLLLWFLGEPIEGTHIGTNYGTPWMHREGTSHVTMRFANNTLGYHFGTWGARGSRLRYTFHAQCTEGMLEANFQEGKLIAIKGYDDHIQEEVLLTCENDKFVQNEMKHFLECLHTGARPLTGGINGLQSLRVIWKLYEAERNGVVADLRGLGLD